MPSGPPPKPPALKVLAGNPGGKRLKPGPTLPLADPEPPGDLSGAARAIWQARAADLLRAGMAPVDCGHAARACRLEALGLELLGRAEGRPLATTRANGRQPSAEFVAALKAFEAADRIWYRFGITPSERSRLAVEPPRNAHAEKARRYFGD